MAGLHILQAEFLGRGNVSALTNPCPIGPGGRLRHGALDGSCPQVWGCVILNSHADETTVIPRAASELLPLVYDDLRRLAERQMAQESPGHSLQATALVHEAYLRLVGDGPEPRWDGRGHFFAAAAQAMRHILVEAARRRARLKRGGDRLRTDLDDVPAPETDIDLVALDEALTRLADEDPLAARVVELRQFAGLGHEEVAKVLGMTVYLARKKWTYARAWLRDALDA